MCFAKVGDNENPVLTEVPVLLPHEILDAVYRAGPLQVGKLNQNGLGTCGGTMSFEFQKMNSPKKVSCSTMVSPCSIWFPAVCTLYDWPLE